MIGELPESYDNWKTEHEFWNDYEDDGADDYFYCPDCGEPIGVCSGNCSEVDND